VFRGAGGLSRAVQDIGGEKVTVLSADGEELASVDVGDDNDFEQLLQARAQWVHGAPPCKTFSAARRTDMHANVKRLRSSDRPQGFGGEATETANKLALRMLELARAQMARGKFFSIENPHSSIMWELKQYAKLAKEDGVRLVRVHQCRGGSLHKKETGILTNAPWIVDMICDIEVRPHHHVPLVGLVEDFRSKDAGRVFYTELAAEYPEGLCNIWAEAAMSWLGDGHHGEPSGDSANGRSATDASLTVLTELCSQGTSTAIGRSAKLAKPVVLTELCNSVHPAPGRSATDAKLAASTELYRQEPTGASPAARRSAEFARPVVLTELCNSAIPARERRTADAGVSPQQASQEPPQDDVLQRGVKLVAAKEVRERENFKAIGGLRNPNKAVAKSKKLQEVGRRARSVFEKLGENADYRAGVVAAVNRLGDKTAEGFPENIVQELRGALRKEFGTKEPEKKTVFDYELWRAMLRAADDQEVDVPDWLENGCPTGIGDSVIHARGIFPKIDSASAAVMSSKEFAKEQAVFDWRSDRHRNYVSFFVDDGKCAKAEIDRIEDRGFIETFDSWSEVLDKWPQAKASKVTSLSAPQKKKFELLIRYKSRS
jgi:hypothetical protein